MQLIFVQFAEGDVIVRCPHCQHEGELMSDFSLLKAGFNGIKPGEPDDCDLQECGKCGQKLAWDSIPCEPEEAA